MPDLRQGCAIGKSQEDTVPADALVLFGAMGDLAHKKIFPAFYHMVQHGHLDIPVIGVARAGRTNEHLKERVQDSIQEQGGEVDQEALAKLLKLLRYVGGDYEKGGTFDLLKKTLGSASPYRVRRRLTEAADQQSVPVRAIDTQHINLRPARGRKDDLPDT